MRYLLIVNAALFTLMLTLASVLAVVCLLYAFNAGLSPRIAAELPLLIATTLTFSLLTVVLGAAFWGLWRDHSWRWFGQAGAVLGLGAAGIYLSRLLIA